MNSAMVIILLLLASFLLYFFCFVVHGGEVDPKTGKKVFQEPSKDSKKRVSRKVESNMMGKTGVWHLRKVSSHYGATERLRNETPVWLHHDYCAADAFNIETFRSKIDPQSRPYPYIAVFHVGAIFIDKTIIADTWGSYGNVAR